MEEDVDMKNQYRIQKFSDSISIREPDGKVYVDKKFTDPSIKKNRGHVDFGFKDKNLDNVRFFKTNSMPAVPKRLIAKYYVDQAISSSVDEPTLIRNN